MLNDAIRTNSGTRGLVISQRNPSGVLLPLTTKVGDLSLYQTACMIIWPKSAPGVVVELRISNVPDEGKSAKTVHAKH